MSHAATLTPTTPACFFHGHGPCDGRLIGAHLISRQVIRREVGKKHAMDPRVIVPCCGGPTGCSGHHGMFDTARTIRIARADLPPAVEEFAAEHGLLWWLDRTYGEMAA